MLLETREFLTKYLHHGQCGTVPKISIAGLCSNALCNSGEVWSDLKRMITADFSHNSRYPFGSEVYDEEAASGTHHLNPKRLRWIRVKLRQPSSHLQDFLREYLIWVERGAVYGPFNPANGLCGNYQLYLKGHRLDARYHGEHLTCLRDILKEDFGECNYPFGGMQVYDSEARFRAHHTNQARINWINMILGGRYYD